MNPSQPPPQQQPGPDPSTPQPPPQRLMNIVVLRHILEKSKYIPESLRAESRRGLAKYQVMSNIWAWTFYGYLFFNMFTARYRWYRLTTNWRIVLNKCFLLIMTANILGTRATRESITLYRNNKQVFDSNWAKIVEELGIQSTPTGFLTINPAYLQNPNLQNTPNPNINQYNPNMNQYNNQYSPNSNTNPNNSPPVPQFFSQPSYPTGNGPMKSEYSNWAEFDNKSATFAASK